MSFQENAPPGQYVLYYSWNGAYSDILDINVHAKADQIIKDEERCMSLPCPALPCPAPI